MSVTTEQVESRVVETLASFGPDASQITRLELRHFAANGRHAPNNLMPRHHRIDRPTPLIAQRAGK